MRVFVSLTLATKDACDKIAAALIFWIPLYAECVMVWRNGSNIWQTSLMTSFWPMADHSHCASLLCDPGPMASDRPRSSELNMTAMSSLGLLSVYWSLVNAKNESKFISAPPVVVNLRFNRGMTWHDAHDAPCSAVELLLTTSINRASPSPAMSPRNYSGWVHPDHHGLRCNA